MVASKGNGAKTVIKKDKRDGFWAELMRNKVMFLMLIPTATYFILNNYLPMAGIYMAFTRFNFSGGIFGSPFVGWENFRFLVASGKLWDLTLNTVSYNVMFILTDNVLQITLAIILSRLGSKLFTRITQSVMFLPYFVSFVILNVIVYNIFNFEIGFLNSFLRSIDQAPYDAYNQPNVWRFLLLFFHEWKGVGYGTVIYLATITGISTELYEAADIDGANVFQQIRYITLPLLFPTAVILLLFALGRIMRGQLDLFYQVIGNNGVLFAVTDILDTFVYRSLRLNFDVGMGTAAGLYQSVFGFVVIMCANTFIRKYQSEYALF